MKLQMRFLCSWCIALLLNWQTPQLQAQDLLEVLGGIPTSFQLTANQKDLPVIDQYLIQRAGTVEDGFRELGAGFQSWHLAFTSSALLPRTEDRISFDEGMVIQLSFYNAGGNLLFHSQVDRRGFKSPGELTPKKQYYYEIDLRSVPIMVLKDAARIAIARRWKPI